MANILRRLWSEALSSDEAIDRSPINAAKLFERFVCGGRLILRGQHHAPVRRRKCDRPVWPARSLTTCGKGSHLIISRHTAIHLKVAQAQACATPQNNTATSCSGNKLIYSLPN